MSTGWLLVLHFGFVLAAVSGALAVALRRMPAAAQPVPAPAAPEGQRWTRKALGALLELGTAAAPSDAAVAGLRARLAAAGYRHPAAPELFHGIRMAGAAAAGILMAAASLWQGSGTGGALLAGVCGAGAGFLAPGMVLEARRKARIHRIHRGLPPALDLMVLSVEGGQSLDVALAETSRELRWIHPELAAEFGQVQLEIRAGRQRAEVLAELGRRTGSAELKKLAVVLIDSDRFGTSLAPALRTHARFLRTRRRQMAQEAARKLGVKLIFPVFFLIMPSVFVVTLGPAVLAFLDAMETFFTP